MALMKMDRVIVNEMEFNCRRCGSALLCAGVKDKIVYFYPCDKCRNKIDVSYVEFIQNKDCLRCGEPAPSEGHHVSVVGDVMGGKVTDYNRVPLCGKCHRLIEDGSTNWKAEDFLRWIVQYNQEWIRKGGE